MVHMTTSSYHKCRRLTPCVSVPAGERLAPRSKFCMSHPMTLQWVDGFKWVSIAGGNQLCLNGDDPATIQPGLIDGFAAVYTDMARVLDQLTNRQDPALRVVNISWGQSRNMLYHTLWQQLNILDMQGKFAFSRLRQLLLGGAENNAAPDAQSFHLRNFVDTLLDRQLAIIKARRRYIESTRRAAERGIVVMVAVGNMHNSTLHPFETRPGTEMNWLVESPYVISLEVCSTNQTPGWRENYRIAGFSARGSGRDGTPTITAPGVLLPLSSSFGSVFPNNVATGTSYRVAWVAGVVLMMLQLKPNGSLSAS